MKYAINIVKDDFLGNGFAINTSGSFKNEVTYTISTDIITLNAYPDGRKVQFTRFSMFLSDVRLFSGSEQIELAEVDFVNLTSSHSDATGANNGFRYKSTQVELASIDEISFNVGLTETQNSTVPADYASSHPLARPGE